MAKRLIKWRKIKRGLADGYIGKIRCFEIEQHHGSQAVTLTCELPHVRDTLYGRLITEHHSAGEASAVAEATLKVWLRRLKDA